MVILKGALRSCKLCYCAVLLQSVQTFYQSAPPCVGLLRFPDLVLSVTVGRLSKVCFLTSVLAFSNWTTRTRIVAAAPARRCLKLKPFEFLYVLHQDNVKPVVFCLLSVIGGTHLKEWLIKILRYLRCWHISASTKRGGLIRCASMHISE